MDWAFTPHPELDRLITDIARRYPQQRPAGLATFRHILNKVGNPHLSMPPVFHVAGTNGKGSTLAFLQALLESGGCRVHKFTSPHLVRFEERIILQGRQIDSDVLADAVRGLDAVLEDGSVSFFEFFTLIAFQLFAAFPADAALLETGLGGLHDATNVIEDPAAALLTKISFDHRHILGRTIADIAAQKAGIIKNDRPVIIAPAQPQEALDIFMKIAADKNAPVTLATIDPNHMPPARLLGAHQKENAATAIAALKQTGFKADIAHALMNAHWAGRLQKLEEGRLATLAGASEIWLDGAHNDSGAAALAQHISDHWRDLPLDILFALKRGKRKEDILSPLAQLAGRMIAVSMPQNDHITPAGHYGLPVAENLISAISSLADGTPRRILVTGSLYLVGQALRENEYS